MDDIIVVSDMGEQWSPKVDPAKIEAIELKNIALAVTAVIVGSALGNCQAKGITIGVKIAIVPHEVPVAKEMAAAIKNDMAGSIAGERKSFVK